MRSITLPTVARLVGVLAAVVAAAGISLEVWCAVDRAHAGSHVDSPEAATHAVLTHPSSESFSRLARVDAATGNVKGAAWAAGVAARIKPTDPRLAAEAARAVDAAVRAEVLATLRPATAASTGLLVVLALAAWHKRREARTFLRTMEGARGRLRLQAEGARPAVGSDVMVDDATRSIVVDAELPSSLTRLRRPPAATVLLSNSAADRTIRLAPRADVATGAVRWRIGGETLRSIASAPGRWRVWLRVGTCVLAESALLVTPTARRLAA